MLHWLSTTSDTGSPLTTRLILVSMRLPSSGLADRRRHRLSNTRFDLRSDRGNVP